MVAAATATFPAWHMHPDAWALMGAIELAYLFAVFRWARPDAGESTSRRKIFLFSAGVFTLWLASDWPIHDLAEEVVAVHLLRTGLIGLG